METAARQLQSKVEAARAVLERAAAAEYEFNKTISAAASGTMTCANAVSSLAALEIRLALLTGPIFISGAGGGTARVAAAAEYLRVISTEDFSNIIDKLVKSTELSLMSTILDPKRKKQYPHLSAEITRLIAVYPYGAIEYGKVQRDGAKEFEKCYVCGGSTAVDAARSVLRCRDHTCGAIRELVGTVFDDSQFYSQEGQKAKSGTFNPNRHFQFWWTHILAREPEDELGDNDGDGGEQLLDVLRAIVVRDRKVLRLLTVNDVRAMLRETAKTELNKNVPLILKKLTGVGPPQVPDSLTVRVENLFTKAIEIGERVRRSGRINRNYYPYYIYRIVEALTTEADVEIRRMLYYIYIQSKDTVDADDEDWELICAELKEIAYKPTDRTLGDRYAPI